MRVIDENGKQLGVLSFQDAMDTAWQSGLDLVKITDNVEPPVCKIMDYGKYTYQEQKKAKKQQHQKGSETKSIRLTYNISPNDMGTRVKTAEKFLKKGHKLRIELVLRGRQKAYSLREHAQEKIKQFLEILQKSTNIKIERELKKEGKGLTMIIAKQ